MKLQGKQQGFTLIELVIVIVILGILAATAAPKFINLQGDAREGTLNAMKASMETAAAAVHAKALIKGFENNAYSDGKTVTVSGTNTVTLHKGYPSADTADWLKLLDFSSNDFETAIIGTKGSGTAIYSIYPKGKKPGTPADNDVCSVQYTETNTGTKPDITVTVGC